MKRLNERKRTEVLRLLRCGTGNLESLASEQGVSEENFVGWLLGPQARRVVMATCTAETLRAQLLLSHVRVAAVEHLARLAAGDRAALRLRPEVVRRACMDILSLDLLKLVAEQSRLMAEDCEDGQIDRSLRKLLYEKLELEVVEEEV
jgi:hypothetical protein